MAFWKKKNNKKQPIDLPKKPINKHLSVQESIPYHALYRDGVMYLGNHTYSKSVKFWDVSYQLASDEEKERIFSAYCSLINSIDSEAQIQLTFFNETNRTRDFLASIQLPRQDDQFDDIRKEYEDILNSNLEKGNNGLVKKKYLTLSLKAENRQLAKNFLQKAIDSFRKDLQSLGSRSEELSGTERVKLLYDMLHVNRDQGVNFDWDIINSKTSTTKDVISPSSFVFNKKDSFKVGNSIGKTSFIKITASEIEDSFLSELLEVVGNLTITIFIKNVDTTKAIKEIKQKITTIGSSKIKQQQQAIRSGYDYEIASPDLKLYDEDAHTQLEDLQRRNEKRFLVGILVNVMGQTEEEADKVEKDIKHVCQRNNCELVPLDYQQENAFFSSLPLGDKRIQIDRALNTTSTAVFLPFTTYDLFNPAPGSLYYGRNPISQNLIYIDRKHLQNPAGLILGVPGSGKSFSAKREITNVFLATTDDIIICDPESEYGALVNALGGQTIHVQTDSNQYINPLDLTENYGADENGKTENAVSLKSSFIISLCELAKNSQEGLTGGEISAIDRALKEVYRPYFNGNSDRMPTLSDLYQALLDQKTDNALIIAEALEIYVTGTQNIFNHETNVDITSRIVSFDIKGLKNPLQKIAMLVIQDFVWGRVAQNRGNSKYTRFYVDEFHLLLKDSHSAQYSTDIWKRFRKWKGIPTGITQNVKDLLQSLEVENLFDNTDFLYLLNQAPGDRERLVNKLHISGNQLKHVTNSNEGEGLLKFGTTMIPFVDHFPKDTKLYQLMTTKSGENWEQNQF